MAILEFSPEGSSKGSSRVKIGFFGHMPPSPDLLHFEIRKFSCDELTVEQLEKTETAADLVALIWTPKKLDELPRHMRSIVPTLLDNDVRVYIRLLEEHEGRRSSLTRRAVVNALRERGIPTANLYPEEWRALPPNLQERQGSHFMPSVYIFEPADSSWPNIATIVCDHPAGPRPKLTLNFDPQSLVDGFQGSSEGHEERVLLLERAFFDCSDLRLSFLPGGLSGASACKTYACLEAGQIGAYPHLYFVKIGLRKKIIDEHDNYRSFILEYVPFHLGPRLRRERCNLGSTQGILVGDFVEGTESLIACARGGRCGHAISNLFDKTLAGWRKQARPDTARTLGEHLATRWQIEGAELALPKPRADIVTRLGGSIDIPALKRIFETHSATSPLCAPAHGDMHATNVLVRHGDAIIIDFEKMERHYPLTYDPASLEGGLLVEGFVDDLKRKNNKKAIARSMLVKLLKPLYEARTLVDRVEMLCSPGSPVEWYYDCVNQIRIRSWPAERDKGQYALTLALCLIRKGCNTHDKFSKEQDILRAISFFFGQRILRQIESHRSTSGD
jgi:hypothetical protein